MSDLTNNTGPKVIDMLITIDAETMIETLSPGTFNTPTVVPTPLIYMIVKSDEAVFGQASKELKINGVSGDIIRWRASSLSFNDNYQVLLYKYLVKKGEGLLSPPMPLTMTATTPLPNPQDTTKPSSQSRKFYFWQSTLLSPGEVTYAFYFMVLDKESKPLGYFYWDPFIQITSD